MMAQEDGLFNQWVNNKKYKGGGLIQKEWALGRGYRVAFCSVYPAARAHIL